MKLKGKTIGFTKVGKSGYPELTMILYDDSKNIPVGIEVEIKLNGK